MDKSLPNAEIVLEKYYGHKVPDLNDFDAVFSSVTRNNVSHVIYCQYDYMVNTNNPINVDNNVIFQLLEVDRQTSSKNETLNYIKFRLYSQTGSIENIKEYINKCRVEFRAEKNNKLGEDIYYFDHEIRNEDINKSSPYITFSKRPFKTDKTFKNVFFTDKEILEQRVNHFLKERQWYKDRGIPYTLGFMFHGPPGSGKTRTSHLISKLMRKGKLQVNMTEAVLFRTAEQCGFCIDEIERIGSKDKAPLRELLNTAYKKGMHIERSKKKKVDGDFNLINVFLKFQYFPLKAST